MMKIYILIICLEINSIICYETRIEEIRQFNNEYSSSINSENLEDSVELPRHKASGCLCRQYTNQGYVTCYDTAFCKRFPNDVKFRYNRLRLSTTAISVLYKEDMIKNSHLKVFQIEANSQFERIEPGAFNGLINLQNLSLAQNPKLIYLDKNALQGLVNLRQLVLKQNGFLQLSGFIGAVNHANLPQLEDLVISKMLFPKILENDFADLANTTISNLGLLACKIEFIHPNALIIFKNLKTLKLGENDLSANHTADLINVMINHSIPIKNLGLNSMFYKELPIDLLKVIGETNISRLSLSGNRFELIDAFPYMPNLVELKLVGCWILNITNDAFQNLPKLTILKISQNQFAESPSAVLLPNLTYLDISYSGQYFTIDGEIFKEMTNLKHLHLSGNNIRKISNLTFIGLNNLKVLGLKTSTLFYIDNSAFLPLKNLIFLDLRDNVFPTRTFSRYIFQGLEKLEVLLLGNCRISNIEANSEVFSDMHNLQHLGLENNYLKTLPATVLAPLKRLERLDISMNSFQSWNTTMLTPGNNLTTLIAYNNKIRNITRPMIEDFVNLTLISLQQNPFVCQCDDFDALSEIVGMKKYANVFDQLDAHRLFCTFPEEYSNFTILHFFHYIQQDYICIMSKSEQSLLIILAITLIIITVILTVFLYTLRGQIGYLYFLINRYLTNRYDCYDTNTKSTYEYDAFVSYSSEDCGFVEQLVNILETKEPYFKLCVYERDFQIGSEISESVLKSIENSKKILLIVSESYVKSQWCRWEVQVAENKRFFENENGEFVRNSIVIVRLGHLCVKNLSPMLRYLITSRIYLQFEEKDEKEFWIKLKHALGHEEKRIVVKN